MFDIKLLIMLLSGLIIVGQELYQQHPHDLLSIDEVPAPEDKLVFIMAADVLVPDIRSSASTTLT